jgi:hypothetical protein|tara:strand:+ start:370 stop:537 length:168 start_codon:yes stop_codon:yes gene_type:complete
MGNMKATAMFLARQRERIARLVDGVLAEYKGVGAGIEDLPDIGALIREEKDEVGD